MSLIFKLFAIIGKLFALIGMAIAFIWGLIVQGVQAIMTLIAVFIAFLAAFFNQDHQTKLIIVGSIAAVVALSAIFKLIKKE